MYSILICQIFLSYNYLSKYGGNYMKKLQNPFTKVEVGGKFSVVRRFPENTKIPLIVLAFKMTLSALGLFKIAFFHCSKARVMKLEDCD